MPVSAKQLKRSKSHSKFFAKNNPNSDFDNEVGVPLCPVDSSLYQ